MDKRIVLLIVLVLLGAIIAGIYYYNQQALARREAEMKEMQLKGIATFTQPKTGLTALFGGVGNLLFGGGK